ncbi:hypothetical protein DB346_04875 [Verrucomicrobia bacterium LW23]|nr:hypothetical protein DB346_04875 [Verrucomicrobia bacterium LW23]
MQTSYSGGEWFLAFGLLLLVAGITLWAILPGTGVPPLMGPALFSLAFGGWCLWRRGRPSRGGAGEILMMVRRKKAR